MIAVTQDPKKYAVSSWLFVMAALVFLMVVVGGATRLTESGLSMVDWRPVTGILPPVSEADWTDEFAKYQTSPEYKLKNAGMSLAEFKEIFYWEWGHRVLGRVIGLAFFLPLVWFWVRGQIPEGYRGRLIALFILGGSQGLLGWYMVQSGLVDEPAVSQYRLAAHLSLALFIFSALFWTALGLRFSPQSEQAPQPSARLQLFARLTLAVTAVQIVLGAFVAGLKAGYIHNTWPLMDGGLVPFGLTMMDPGWINLFENAVTVQFNHRMGAYGLACVAGYTAWLAWRERAVTGRAGLFLLSALLFQIVVGIITLLMVVPVFWGTLHQAGGVLVLTAALTLVFRSRSAGQE